MTRFKKYIRFLQKYAQFQNAHFMKWALTPDGTIFS